MKKKIVSTKELGITIGIITFANDTIYADAFYPYSKTVPWKITQRNHILVVQLGNQKIHNENTLSFCTSVQWNRSFIMYFFHPQLYNGNMIPLCNFLSPTNNTTKSWFYCVIWFHSQITQWNHISIMFF